MFVEHEFYVGLRDINKKKELSNTSLLSYLENVACIHSEITGYGVTNMEKVNRSWILLSWKIKVLKRPKFNETIKVKTWSRLIYKFYAYRDFEIYNENNEVIAIATSKWVFIDIEKGKIVKVTEDVASKYEEENIAVFEEEELNKFEEPPEFINKIQYKITKNMIDVNKHLHNIYYYDIAREVLPEELENANNFEMIYKHEIKLGEIVTSIYSKQNDYHYVTIKSQDESVVHAIIRLK